MKLSARQGRFLQKVITRWQTEGTIDRQEAEKLSNSFTIQTFDWKKLAKYSFWIAIVCALIAVSSAIADDYIIHFIERIFASSNIALCIALSIFSVGFYYLGMRGRKKRPEKEFSNEALIFVGVLFTAGAVAYFGRACDNGSKHYSILFLIATIIYGGLGLWFPSRMVWVFALLSLGSWFGTETGYISGWGAYYLGMNYPLRFVIFGLAIIGTAFLFKLRPYLAHFYKSTYKMGLLYFFIALWILSIFGNYGDLDKWYNVKQPALFMWGIYFGVAAAIAIVWGIKADDSISRGFGITFLFINLYTRYFEYFWNQTHKAIFFFLLAMSFWLVGTRAERIWNIGKAKNGEPVLATDDVVDDEDD